MDWYLLHEQMLPYIVRIETPNGAGTGFLFGYNANSRVAVVATAAHVVSESDEWHLPIKMTHHASNTTVFLTESDRVMFLDSRRDSASILITADKLPFPAEALPSMESTSFKRVGVKLAWMGYPSVAHPELCFFTGCVSAFIQEQDCYLIDGVAINGVSGGPVFAQYGAEAKPELVGTISSYISNNVNGRSLPGLLRAQDVTAFFNTLQSLRSLDEARDKKQQELQENQQRE